MLPAPSGLTVSLCRNTSPPDIAQSHALLMTSGPLHQLSPLPRTSCLSPSCCLLPGRLSKNRLGLVIMSNAFKTLLFLFYGKLKVKVTQLCLTLCDSLDYTVHGILQARVLEWVAFPFSRGSNPDLPHCRWILYQLSHKGSQTILEWVTFPFSRGSSQPRDQTQVSHTAGGFFTS